MQQNRIKERGQIMEALPSLLLKVKLDSGQDVLAHLAGKLKMNRIKVLPGDNVLVERSQYDEKRGRIVYRLK